MNCMGSNADNLEEYSVEKGDEPEIDWWSDEGVRILNEALDEGSAYMLAHPGSYTNFEECLDDNQCECLDPELYDPAEERLPPGEIEMILENCFIM